MRDYVLHGTGTLFAYGFRKRFNELATLASISLGWATGAKRHQRLVLGKVRKLEATQADGGATTVTEQR